MIKRIYKWLMQPMDIGYVLAWSVASIPVAILIGAVLGIYHKYKYLIL